MMMMMMIMRTENDNIKIYTTRYVKCLSQDSSVSIMITLRAGWLNVSIAGSGQLRNIQAGHRWGPPRVLISATERAVPLDEATGMWSHIVLMLREAVELNLHRTRPPLPRVPSSHTWRQLLFEQDDLCVHFVVCFIGPYICTGSNCGQAALWSHKQFQLETDCCFRR